MSIVGCCLLGPLLFYSHVPSTFMRIGYVDKCVLCNRSKLQLTYDHSPSFPNSRNSCPATGYTMEKKLCYTEEAVRAVGNT